MTNKLDVIINSLKVPKIKKMLLYEIKFLVPYYSCLQNPWLGGYRPQIPVLLSSVLNWICWTPPLTKFLGTPLCNKVWVKSWVWQREKAYWCLPLALIIVAHTPVVSLKLSYTEFRDCNKRCEENGVTGVVKGMLSYCDTFLRSPGSKVMVRMM